MEQKIMQLWEAIKHTYLAPGEAMLNSLAHTPWGKDWVASPPPWEITAIVSLLFWCIVISLLGAMNDRVRGMLVRNERRSK